MQDLKKQLAVVRRFTGDKFSPAKGYDLRKGISKARQKTIHKYHEMILELTTRPHKIIDVPKGWKREAFEFTGQKSHPRFVKAIVHTPDPEARYNFTLDKTRPKGSRFVVVNRRTKEKSWHIPAKVFSEENEALYDPDADVPAEFFEAIIRDYGEGGETFVIEAGEFHVWGTAGSPNIVAAKLASLFKNYDADKFDANDRNSHFIGNWFRGVQVFASRHDFMPYADDRARAEGRRLVEYGLEPFQKFKVMKDGRIGYFYRGEFQTAVYPSQLVQTGGWGYKPADNAAQERRRAKLLARERARRKRRRK